MINIDSYYKNSLNGVRFIDLFAGIGGESVKRNINRMLSYYFQTGSQARSGRRYLLASKKLTKRNRCRNTLSILLNLCYICK